MNAGRARRRRRGKVPAVAGRVHPRKLRVPGLWLLLAHDAERNTNDRRRAC